MRSGIHSRTCRSASCCSEATRKAARKEVELWTDMVNKSKYFLDRAEKRLAQLMVDKSERDADRIALKSGGAAAPPGWIFVGLGGHFFELLA